MNDIELERSFGFLVHDVARLLTKRFDQRARNLGLTRAQWRALAYIARQEGINQAGLADMLEVEPITLVRLVDRMEEAGWLERRAHPSDRRQRLLYLTDKARPIFARMRLLARDLKEDAMAGVAPADRERLTDLLIRIRANLTERGMEGEPAPDEGMPRARSADR